MSQINVENTGESRVLVTVTNLSAQPIRVLNEGSSRLVVKNQASPVVNVTIRKNDAPRILVGGGQRQTTVRAINFGAPRIVVRVRGIQGANGAGAEDFADMQAEILTVNNLALQNQQNLSNHTANTNNPHNTTAAQVGADPAGSAAAAQAFAIQRGNHTGMQAQSTITNLIEDLSNKADLVDGVLSTAQLPALAVTEYLGNVASEAAMLALVGQKGDWAIRSDLGMTAIITGNDPTFLASWTFLSYPAAPVSSVNGQTGFVVITKNDLGLSNVNNTADADKPVSTDQGAAIAAAEASAEAAANDYTDDVALTLQPINIDLTALSALTDTGILRRNGAGNYSAGPLLSTDVFSALGYIPANSTGALGLPLVTGEISGGQPVFVYADDGSLFTL